MAQPPDIVFLFSDQHAQRVAGCYGDTQADTPNLDRLATLGSTFTNAYCPAPLCVPSRMAMLSGRYPAEIDCFGNLETLHTDTPTFAHALGVAGYGTTLVGRMHWLGPDQTHGFAERRVGEVGPTWAGARAPELGAVAAGRGSDGPSLRCSGSGYSAHHHFDVDVTGEACAVIDARAAARRAGDRRPFCLMASWFLPHNPFVAEREDYEFFRGRVDTPALAPPVREHPYLRDWRGRTQTRDVPAAVVARARTAYYGNVRKIDRMLGRVLDRLRDNGLFENTLVVYASDHGEQLGERGLWGKATFFDQSAKVPLVIAWPGRLPANRRRDEVVGLLDVNATLLEAAGAPALPNARGRSLLRVMDGAATAWRQETFAEFYGGLMTVDAPGVQQRMIRTDAWKLIYYHGHRPQLFDMRSDPHERNDLAGTAASGDIEASLGERLRDGWNPHALARRIAEKTPETALRVAWARATAPAEPHRYPLRSPGENWLDID